MYKKKSVWLFLMGIQVFFPSYAETLLELYNLAELNDPTLKAANAERLAVLEKKPQAQALLRPQVSLGADITENWRTQYWFGGDDIENISAGYNLTLNQSLYRRDRNIAITQIDLQIAEITVSYENARQTLMEKLATRYFNVLAARDNIQFAQGAKEAFKRQWDQAQQRFDVGLIAITDVQEAKASYDLSIADEIQAKNQLDNAREALREVTGNYYETLGTLQEEIPLVVPEPADIHVWTEIALGRNPQLIAGKRRVEQVQQEIEKQRAALLPTLDIIGRHQHGNVLRGDEPVETGGTDNRVGIQLNYSLYEGGAIHARIREAQQNYTQALQQLEQQRRTVQLQTHNTYLNVLSNISRVKALKQALLSTKAALEAIKTGFEVGTRTSIDVVNVQRDLLAAQRNYATARYDYILNKLRLRQVAGIINVEDLDKITAFLTPTKKN